MLLDEFHEVKVLYRFWPLNEIPEDFKNDTCFAWEITFVLDLDDKYADLKKLKIELKNKKFMIRYREKTFLMDLVHPRANAKSFQHFYDPITFAFAEQPTAKKQENKKKKETDPYYNPHEANLKKGTKSEFYPDWKEKKEKKDLPEFSDSDEAPIEDSKGDEKGMKPKTKIS